ncbi:MAG: sulfite exporter TauE/SafE family protein [Candidatus Nanopelagicales bacterium]
MPSLVLIAFAGLIAQFVDGSLGMGYGLTSSTLLIAVGLSPALASASVHLAEIGTTAVSGIAHHRFGNVDWPTVKRVAIPGAIGAFAGATFLSSISTAMAKPVAGGILFVLGVYVLLRFLLGRAPRRKPGTPGLRLLLPLGIVGGFVDATGGGGWGPVTTPTLLADGRLAPNRVIGTVNASEFMVALAASIGFLIGLGTAGIDLGIVIALLAGGVIAAPAAAWVVRRLNARILGVVVGGFICFTNARLLLGAAGASSGVTWAVYAALVAVWVASVIWVVAIVRREREAADVGAEPELMREASA